MSTERLGEILRNRFGVSAEAVEAALADQRSSGKRIGKTLLARGAVSGETLAEALALQFDLPYRSSLIDDATTEGLLDDVPIAMAREYAIFPLERSEERFLLAVSDPLDGRPFNDLAVMTGCAIERIVVPEEEIRRAINRAYEKKVGESGEFDGAVQDLGPDTFSENLQPDDLLDSTDEAPVIRFVNALITRACRERASDIHVEPFETELVVRYRIDGVLYEVLRPPLKARSSITSRLKIMARLDIAEKRLPQDGRFRVRIAGKDIDVRVSTLPTAFGERVVLRLLDRSAGVRDLGEIGLENALLVRIERMITKNHGIFLVTGPTGSGKTTTLYAALSRLNGREKNIITIEDPIEYQLAGVGQIQVNPKINLTFAAGLRSILRQDPDIIMVGEIRDRETAEMAVQSALTGHMVFSTLHTNDAASALTRLVEMGIEPFLAASSVVGIVAQRLVRTICPHCREAYHPSPELLREAGLDLPEDTLYYRGKGCDHCLGIGFRGRTGIYELLPLTDEVREMVMKNTDAATIRRCAVSGGMTPLLVAGVNKAAAGETTLEEVLRVVREE